ncbi:unnamed protein product [Miscanthus lutarioriparius]|uniref:Uncharacterized protein n=1 Tax=Miscanthus lutarioriparius TaxID=422564 RepID=A0A811PQJ4_9POAL|nr:unnamed protein product [Miscanthus lutarioriparius]
MEKGAKTGRERNPRDWLDPFRPCVPQNSLLLMWCVAMSLRELCQLKNRGGREQATVILSPSSSSDYRESEMGCVSSKILAKSGSFQEKVSCSLGHSFQRSSAIEEIILSTSKSNGDQFLALLRSSTSSARKAKEPAEVHSPATAPAPAEPPAKIETIDVSELLAGLEEEGCCTAEQARERRQSSRDGSPAPWPASVSDGGAAGRARSFRTVEEFDAMVLTQQQQHTQSESGSSSERATALATEHEEELATATAAAAAAASTAEAELSGGSGSKAAAGAKRRARARQLGELSVPAAAFDFSISKSGSLRDWLRQGGQIFSPGSYVTPRFGTSPTPAERGGGAGGEQQQALFDPELVAQFERAMEQLSEDEGRVLDEILEALELEAVEKDGAAAAVGGVRDGQPADVAAAALVQQV